jgi:tripartite-type tricarboxylate transporter receptor subunit TctC
MKKVERPGLWLVCIVSLLALIGAPAFGQEAKYPVKPIQVIIPFGTGGTNDISARIVDSQIQEILRVPVIHINKPGGGGVTGTAFVKEQKPDGYTILWGSGVAIEMSIVTPNCPYKVQDFVPIALVTHGYFILAVKKDAPWNTLEDFITAAKKDPGKISVGNAGIGTSQHLVTKLLELEAKINLNSIPFKGDGPAIPALLGGHVNAVMSGIGAITPYLLSGEARGLASSGPEHHPALKQIPLFKEKGLPGVSKVTWTGPVASAGTPEPIIKILSDAYQVAANHPSVLVLLEKSGTIPKYVNREDGMKVMQSEYKSYYNAAKAAGLIK